MKFKIQYDEEANYRLIVDEQRGQWTAYNKVAVCNDYVAFSEYWNKPATNRVFRLIGDDDEGIVVGNVKGIKPKY